MCVLCKCSSLPVLLISRKCINMLFLWDITPIFTDLCSFSMFSSHQCIPGYRAEEAVEMLKTFYKQENPNGQFTSTVCNVPHFQSV